MINRFPKRIPEWIAIEIYRNRDASESALTFVQFVKLRNWILEYKPQGEAVAK